MNNLLKSWFWIIMAALIVTPMSIVTAVNTPIDLSGSSWEMTGSVKASASKIGTINQKGQVDIYFGANIDAGLADGEFSLLDPQGGIISGTYETRMFSEIDVFPFCLQNKQKRCATRASYALES